MLLYSLMYILFSIIIVSLLAVKFDIVFTVFTGLGISCIATIVLLLLNLNLGKYIIIILIMGVVGALLQNVIAAKHKVLSKGLFIFSLAGYAFMVALISINLSAVNMNKTKNILQNTNSIYDKLPVNLKSVLDQLNDIIK